jgi:hypothetical protein
MITIVLIFAIGVAMIACAFSERFWIDVERIRQAQRLPGGIVGMKWLTMLSGVAGCLLSLWILLVRYM